MTIYATRLNVSKNGSKRWFQDPRLNQIPGHSLQGHRVQGPFMIYPSNIPIWSDINYDHADQHIIKAKSTKLYVYIHGGKIWLTTMNGAGRLEGPCRVYQ